MQRELNQSIGDGPNEEKVEAYATISENLLERNRHDLSYTNNSAFLWLTKYTKLPFRSYVRFELDEQADKQELYIRRAEIAWNSSRFRIEE